MGKPTGFLEYPRRTPAERPPAERVGDSLEFALQLPVAQLREQGARCMDCGVPFCHSGCPLGNVIPDFNDLVYRGDWEQAVRVLHSTNNFPEITGRVCPAPCEESCVLAINAPAVTIKNIELAIIERAFEEGWVTPQPPSVRTGKRVAVVGSGPAGLAAADQLNKVGHAVTVLERADRIGGLLRYGIPDFKLEKHVLDRRLAILEREGIVFKPSVNVGFDVTADKLLADFDAIVLCGGSTRPRDLPVPGRDLDGIHFAMDFLSQQNRRVAGDMEAVRTDGWWFGSDTRDILASGKHVVVIGGGDTGSDCVGTSNRHRAASVTQFELLGQPSEERPAHQPWPYWPMKLRTSSSHREGVERKWSILTKRFVGEGGCVTGVETVAVQWSASADGTGPAMTEIPGTQRVWSADLVLLALGFVGPETGGVIEQLDLALDARRNVQTDAHYRTSVPGVFACGDMSRGQSLVVWAISEGREAARSVDHYLMGETELPTKGPGDLPML